MDWLIVSKHSVISVVSSNNPFPHTKSQELARHPETNSTVVVSGRAILSVIKSWVFTYTT